MKNEQGTLTESWYLLGVLLWRKKRVLTLEEQAFQIKKELDRKVEKVLDQNEIIKKEINRKVEKVLSENKNMKNAILTEINQSLDELFKPVAKRKNVD